VSGVNADGQLTYTIRTLTSFPLSTPFFSACLRAGAESFTPVLLAVSQACDWEGAGSGREMHACGGHPKV